MKKLLHTKALVTKSEQEDGVLEAVVGSTAVIDRYGDTINQDGWELKNYKDNPVILWGHNVREDRPPIGIAVKTWLDGVRKKKLMFTIKFDLQDSFAAEVYRKYKDGFLYAFSVGFMPLEWEDNEFTKMELLELSAVPVPANPEAVVSIKNLHPVNDIKDLFTPVKDIKKTFPDIKIVESKKALPFQDLGILPESENWDGPGEIAKADIDTLKLMAAWFDNERSEEKSSYLLVHHRALDKKANWRGVLSAMAILMGAKEVGIPEADRKKVYNHLAKHYEQFEQEAPEFKLVEAQVLKGLQNEIGALILDREEKHVVRLIKQLSKTIKTHMKEEKPVVVSPTENDVKTALQIIDKALESSLKGGE